MGACVFGGVEEGSYVKSRCSVIATIVEVRMMTGCSCCLHVHAVAATLLVVGLLVAGPGVVLVTAPYVRCCCLYHTSPWSAIFDIYVGLQRQD